MKRGVYILWKVPRYLERGLNVLGTDIIRVENYWKCTELVMSAPDAV